MSEAISFGEAAFESEEDEERDFFFQPESFNLLNTLFMTN